MGWGNNAMFIVTAFLYRSLTARLPARLLFCLSATAGGFKGASRRCVAAAFPPR